MNFDLKSVPFEYLEKLKVRMDEVNTNYLLNYIRIGSSNLSLYGVDLYKEQRAHEAIKILTGADCIKWAEVGALINFYPKLINEIINNEKIKSVFISLESGSERVYNLMNRPIPLNKLKEIIKLIRKERPDILINTEIICGFPTETLSDLYKSIDTLYELDINPQFLHPYMNSYCVPSSKLQQHSLDKCIELVRYAEERLIGLSSKFNKFVRDGEKIVVSKDDELRLYSLMSIDGTVDYDFYDEFEEEYEVNDVFNRSLVKKYK